MGLALLQSIRMLLYPPASLSGPPGGCSLRMPKTFGLEPQAEEENSEIPKFPQDKTTKTQSRAWGAGARSMKSFDIRRATDRGRTTCRGGERRGGATPRMELCDWNAEWRVFVSLRGSRRTQNRSPDQTLFGNCLQIACRSPGEEEARRSRSGAAREGGPPGAFPPSASPRRPWRTPLPPGRSR